MSNHPVKDPIPAPSASDIALGGTFTPAGTALRLRRMGFGAMQLTGPMVWGPPKDREAARAVVREAVNRGVNHIDTSDYYGPRVANDIIREALHPYAGDLTIVTKVGARRGPDKSWPKALSRQELIDAVHDNLRRLEVDALDVVNLRLGDAGGTEEASLEAPLTVLAELQQRGLIRHIGLSNITRRQFHEGIRLAEIVCVQNHYNLAHRADDAFIDELSARGVAYVPFFPLGGFRALRSPTLDAVARELGAKPQQVALAWLLQRSPNILVIAGTSSIAHLRQNLQAGTLALPRDAVSRLAAVGTRATPETEHEA